MRRAGQPLDRWQEDSITAMLAVRGDGKWACFEFCEWCPRQNGKGGILEARALAGLLLLGEQLIMWSAHEYKTAMEAFRRVVWLLGKLGEKLSDTLYVVDGSWVKVSNTNGEEGLERLDTGQRLKFIARSKGSGRGFSGDVNIIDETFAYTAVQQSALMPTMSARSVEGNPQIIYASSPPLTGATGEVMYALRRRGDPDAPRAKNDPAWEQDDSLGYRDWGLGGDLDHLDKVDLGDEANWSATNPAKGIRISREHIAREFRAMSAEDFARERLGIWPREVTASVGWKVIPEEDWAAGLDPESQLADPVALAVSVSWDRSRASICAGGSRTDGFLHGETIDNRAGTGWVVKRLVELVRDWGPCAVVVNPGGPAGSLIPEIEAEGIEVKKVTSRETAQAYGALYDAICGKPYLEGGEPVNPRRFRHIGDEELTNAVMVAQTRPLGDGHAWDLKDAVGDLTPLDGVTLALHGYLTRPTEEPVNPPATAKSAPPADSGNLYRPTSRLSI